MTCEGAKPQGKESNTGPKRRNSEGSRGKETSRGPLGETDLSEEKERQEECHLTRWPDRAQWQRVLGRQRAGS